MPVDPNDLLIFKMRGMKAKPKKPEKKVKVPEPLPEREQVFERAPEPQIAPVYEAPVQESKPAKPQKVLHREEPARQKTEEQLEREIYEVTREKPKPEEEMPIGSSRQFYGYEPQGRDEPRPTVEHRGKMIKARGVGFFSGMTGFLFVLNALIFGYYIYPQSIFIVNYIYSTGIARFFSSYNMGYYFSFFNLALAVLSFIGGLFMFAKGERGHLFSGVVGAMVILTVTYEYLQSNLIYLLVVSAIAFVSIGTLTYARMSAESMATEREELAPEEIDWPRIETF